MEATHAVQPVCGQDKAPLGRFSRVNKLGAQSNSVLAAGSFREVWPPQSKRTLPLQDLPRPFALHCFCITSQHSKEVFRRDILQTIGSRNQTGRSRSERLLSLRRARAAGCPHGSKARGRRANALEPRWTPGEMDVSGACPPPLLKQHKPAIPPGPPRSHVGEPGDAGQPGQVAAEKRPPQGDHAEAAETLALGPPLASSWLPKGLTRRTSRVLKGDFLN